MKIWLYRKNNAEQPYRWSAELNANKTYITVQYGIVGKATYTDSYKVTQKMLIKSFFLVITKRGNKVI